MKCWHCGSDVIWGGDHTYEDYGLDGDGIVSNLSCSECPADYLCYLSDEEDDPCPSLPPIDTIEDLKGKSSTA